MGYNRDLNQPCINGPLAKVVMTGIFRENSIYKIIYNESMVMIKKRMQLGLSAVALLQMSFMAQFYQASRTKNGAWLTLLALKDVSFGRTDP